MKGSHNPGKEFAGQVSLKHIFEIAKIKRSVNYLNFLWKDFWAGKADFGIGENRKSVSLVSRWRQLRSASSALHRALVSKLSHSLSYDTTNHIPFTS